MRFRKEQENSENLANTHGNVMAPLTVITATIDLKQSPNKSRGPSPHTQIGLKIILWMKVELSQSQNSLFLF